MKERHQVAPVVALVMVVLLGAASGCSGFSRDDGLFSGRSSGDEEVTLDVDNRNFNDARLFAVWRGGPRVRIGRISGSSSGTFRIEWRTNELQIEVDFLAGRGYTSEAISVNRGDRLEFVIRP